jgi:signal transduction histidine kinase
VTCCVRDFGIGIPLEQQSQVFNRFYRVSGQNTDTFPGLGLGLYISSEILKRQKGRIQVKSQPQVGSDFCFSLPLYKNEEENLRS